MYHCVYWTKLLTMLKFDEICRNLRELAGIGGNHVTVMTDTHLTKLRLYNQSKEVNDVSGEA